jgi:hypothetical protein
VTPLAHRLTRMFIARAHDPLTEDEKYFRDTSIERLSGAHFFEVTQAFPLIPEVDAAIHRAIKEDGVFTAATFLPAPKTWIEWGLPGEERCAVFLQEKNTPEDGHIAYVTLFEGEGGAVSLADVGMIRLETGEAGRIEPLKGWIGEPLPKEEQAQAAIYARALLAIKHTAHCWSPHTPPP